jgi:hypothetical protein
VTIPSSVTVLGVGCFAGCSNLTEVTIPSSVTVLGENCFDGCSNLTEVTIPSSVTELSGNCFWGCSNLTEVTIPSSVTVLGVGCFAGCSNLLPPELSDYDADPAAVLAFLQRALRNARRHELLVCVANARREQDAGRGEAVEELLGRIAKLPPEVVRDYVIPHTT